MEELKAGWQVLNERLEQQEILNKRIIKEMVANRTQSAYNRLLRWDMFQFTLCFLGCLFVFIQQQHNTYIVPVSAVAIGLCLVIGAGLAMVKLWYLSRFNMETKTLSVLMRLILKYKWWMKFSYTVGTSLAVCALIFFFIVQKLYRVPAQVTLFGILFLGVIPIAYLEIRFFKKNVAAVTKGLQELEEFEAE